MQKNRLRLIVITLAVLSLILSVFTFIQGYKDGKAAKQAKIQQELKSNGGK